jgi:hypothetical protein
MSQQIANNFKENLVSFIDELIEQFPDETDFLITRMVLKDRITPETVINIFIKDVLPFKDFIKNHDEKFFLETDISVFRGASNKVNHLRLLWKSSTLDTEDKKIIWKWFDTFMYLTDQYMAFKIEK